MMIVVILVTLTITGLSSVLVSARDVNGATMGYKATPTRLAQRAVQTQPTRVARPTPPPRPTRPPQPTRDKSATCAEPFKPVARPLTELGKSEYVRMEGGPTGFTGGLYPGGSNVRPPAHEAAGLAAAKQIQPLDAQGRPDPNGKVVFISVGMSNTSIEFGQFERMAKERKDLNPNLVIINGALAGQTAEKWADPNGRPWPELLARLKHRKVTPEQVQVAWVKQTLTRGRDVPRRKPKSWKKRWKTSRTTCWPSSPT